MANSPVQIVLNSDAFIEALENNGGGGSKDFLPEMILNSSSIEIIFKISLVR